MNMTSSSSNGNIPTEKLHKTLRALWDMMEFYIWHPTLDTAKGIKEGNLAVEKLTAAIHQRHYTKEVQSAIKTQLDYWQSRKISEPYEMTDDVIRFTYEGVPVEIKILKKRYKFFDYPNPVNYNYDDFRLANPFEKYWPARFIVR